jgi:hypothetical protein
MLYQTKPRKAEGPPPPLVKPRFRWVVASSDENGEKKEIMAGLGSSGSGLGVRLR